MGASPGVWVLRASGSWHFPFEGPVVRAGPQLAVIMKGTNGTKERGARDADSSRAAGSAAAPRKRGPSARSATSPLPCPGPGSSPQGPSEP